MKILTNSCNHNTVEKITQKDNTEHKIKTEERVLYVLCGIPGSGKSTAASQFGRVISSDQIREEIFGDESLQYEKEAVERYLKTRRKNFKNLKEDEYRQAGTQMVFSKLNQRVSDALKDGESVVYDATSLTRKQRRQILKRFKGLYDRAVCIFVNTPLEEALKRNRNRTRTVPDDIIRKMSRQLQTPKGDEGFDEIIEILPADQTDKD